MQIFLILSLLIAIALILFAVQNSAVLTVSFLSFHYNGSLALILVMVFALGLLSGILISVPSLLRKSSALREQKRRVKQLEESMTTKTGSSPAGQERTGGQQR
jgi:putative membrane protein